MVLSVVGVRDAADWSGADGLVYDCPAGIWAAGVEG